MRILIVDTETSGLSYDEGARVIEVAAMLYDTQHASPIESYSALIKHHENPAEAINGIPVALLKEQGDEPEVVWRRFCELGSSAECYLAHRAEFDQGFVKQSIERLHVDSQVVGIWEMWDPKKPWVCSKSDIRWIGDRRGEHLVQLALSMGLGVASAHRAMADVDTLARVLTRAKELGADLAGMIRLGMRPKVRVIAKVSYDDRHMAKDAGFFWDESKRQWYRMMPREDMVMLPFHAVVDARS